MPEALFARVAACAPWPRGVRAVPEQVRGPGFFPAASGLYATPGAPLPPFPFGGVMVLGHNVDNVTGYAATRERGGEDLDGPTWRNLVALLRRAGISPESCFFTNFFMGLMESESAVGAFPGRADAAFVERCRRFFLEQVAFQEPRAVLVLGREVPPLLAPLSPDLAPWRAARTLGDVDAAGAALLTTRFAGRESPVPFAVLTHPSLRAANVRRRCFEDAEGDAAEMRLLARCVGLTPSSTSP
ncbi:MAG TPA: hypothetical protein VNX21_02925 [Candidatus Thermoplasmatota archaeon]|nr:hypothetical protein [Candidatus Thermoplasmatota archaeon]